MSYEPTRRHLLATLGGAAGGLTLGAGTGTSTRTQRDTCHGAEPLSPPRPGPDVLYDDPVTPPQFQLLGDWDADPLWVCGRTAYDDGEFISQIWPFDDLGADGQRSYPAEDRYANNAADILEFRVRPTSTGIAYRIALNTMIEPDAAVVAIGIDEGGATNSDWGHGLGTLGAPVDHVLVTWGTGATLDGDGRVQSVAVDTERNVIEVEVSLNPGRDTWRHYAVSGLYDGDDGFRDTSGSTDPSNAPPVFNVGFRTDEDEPKSGLANWRAQQQASALSNRDISALGADINFARLHDGDVDRWFPQQGRLFNRIYGSRLELGDGIHMGDPRTVYQTRVQPYTIYVPSSYDPDEPNSFLLLLHGLGQNYNSFMEWGANMVTQLGEQRDAIVLMPFGRGPEGWWKNEAEFDAFEAWSDIASRYNIDFDRVTISGYSMGGHGTYRLASLYPDLFARAFPVVGPPAEDILDGPMAGYSPRGEPPGASDSSYSDDSHNMMRVTDNLRHVPMLLWASMADELVPYPGVRNYRRSIDDHGYRHRLDSYPTSEHLLPGLVIDEWGAGREFLGNATVTRQPDRVTYRAVPSFGNDDFGQEYDGAYWVDDIVVADSATGSLTIEGTDDRADGLVDVTAQTRGYGEPVTERIMDGGTDPLPHIQEGRWWIGRADGGPDENAFDVTLSDVVGLTLYVDAVDVDTTTPITLRVESSHPAEITLKSGAGTETVVIPAGESTKAVTFCAGSTNGRPQPRSEIESETKSDVASPAHEPDPESLTPLPRRGNRLTR